MEDGGRKEGCLKIQLLARKTFKFSAHDRWIPTGVWGSEPQAASARLCPALSQGPGPRPLTGRAARPLPLALVCLLMPESHECSSCEAASGGDGRSEVRAIPNSLFWAGRPGWSEQENTPPGAAAPGPGLRGGGLGRGARGLGE
jgi:hypothetical protein